MTNRKIINASLNHTVVATKAIVADSFLKRLRGLLGRLELKQDEGLVIIPCNCVHSFGMKFSIDVIFLSEQGHILSILQNFQPNKISPLIKGAKMTLELPVGSVERLNLQEQQVLQFA